jgi:hypothetical protein
VYVHPHLSTVTYLTNGGNDYCIPTLIVENCRIHNITGEWINNNNDDVDNETKSAFISWPAIGKHLCFDGRFLHAAPSNLCETSHIKNNEPISDHPTKNDNDTKLNKQQRRRQSRYTFLVNIWLYHKPLNVYSFPDSMINKMSGYSGSSLDRQRIRLVLNNTSLAVGQCSTNQDADVSKVTTVTVTSDSTINFQEQDVATANEAETNNITPTSSYAKKESIQQFIWPMGDHNSNETIHVSIPIEIVQSKALCGGNVRVCWNTAQKQSSIGMFLKKEDILLVESDGNNNEAIEIEAKRPRLADDIVSVKLEDTES